jgi:hypothetical protein
MPFAATGTDSNAVVSSVSYEPFGAATQIKFNNGDIDNYTYDKDYWLDSITSTQLTYKENLAYAQDQGMPGRS